LYFSEKFAITIAMLAKKPIAGLVEAPAVDKAWVISGLLPKSDHLRDLRLVIPDIDTIQLLVTKTLELNPKGKLKLVPKALLLRLCSDSLGKPEPMLLLK